MGASALRGLTLAELLVGAAVASILVGVAVPSVATLLASVRLPLGARQVAADLHVARATAVLRNTRARVTFTHRGYTVQYEAGEPREVGAALPPSIRVVSLPRSGMVRFFPTGSADNATVTLGGPSGERRFVVVNQRGRVVIR
jgi:Tfp pilus assembly protein FimT